jgi:hypothetical protein
MNNRSMTVQRTTARANVALAMCWSAFNPEQF